MKRYVVGFLFTPDETRVLLVLKNHPAWQCGKYNGVGGRLEEGESFHDAMVREFVEETGVAIPKWTLVAVHHSVRDGEPSLIHFFRARALTDTTVYQGGGVNDSGEEVRVVVVRSLAEGMVSTIPNLRWLVPMAQSTDSHNWPYTIVEKADAGLEEAVTRHHEHGLSRC